MDQSEDSAGEKGGQLARMIDDDTPPPEEDGNVTPTGTPEPALSPSLSPSLSPVPAAPSPGASGEGGAEGAAGVGVVPSEEGQAASGAPNGIASTMSNNVSWNSWIGRCL